MRRIILLLTATALIIAGTSCAFADDEARDAMIAYSGTESFTRLLPEERQACMYWVSEGGRMSETCRGAVVRLISEDPDAVTPSQRRALLAAASDRVRASTSTPAPAPVPAESTTTVKKDDNTGIIIAAGVIGLIAGMVIHNNVSHSSSSSPRHAPPPPPHRNPAPPHHRPPHR